MRARARAPCLISDFSTRVNGFKRLGDFREHAYARSHAHERAQALGTFSVEREDTKV